MANIKIAILEIDGEELDIPTEYNLTGVDIPFDPTGTGLTSTDLDAAIRELAGNATEYEYFSENSTSQTTSNNWVVKLLEESTSKSGGTYILHYTSELGQSIRFRELGMKVAYRLNATGIWETISNVRNGVSTSGEFKLETGFYELNIPANNTVEIRIQYGQTDSGGTAYIRNSRVVLWKVGA